MALVAPINLPYNIRTLWFDPDGLDIKAADKVVVKTARGIELGVAASDVMEVSEEEIQKLKSPLKPVLRMASDEDLEKAQEMERLASEAMPVFKELARETNEDMHPVSVEYLLDGEKAIFYFESEERIDFRDLVRKLAGRFHVRIDMHQIGVRDEARIIGGLAHCGQEVCCKRLGGEFNPVSIRMAKDQDLSLNPQKISGLCGRLMCCLRYENEVYKDFRSRAPKVGSSVNTPCGCAKVKDCDALRETITVQLDDDKPVKVELADFDPPNDKKRPDTIGKQAWDKANEPEEIDFSGAGFFSTSQFTGVDKLGEATAIHHPSSKSKSGDAKQSKRSRHERSSDNDKAKESQPKARQRRRRSIKIKDGRSSVDVGSLNDQKTDRKTSSGSSKNSLPKAKNNTGSSVKKEGLRPGHKSSGLSSSSGDNRKKREGTKGTSQASSSEKKSDKNKQNSQNRRRRRRSKGASKDAGGQGKGN